MRIFTDPHLGRNAGAHTQNGSAKRLDKAILNNALKASQTPETTVCVGDLFDKSHNKESVIIDGILVARRCDIVLAGNHDLSNRDNTKTSIEVIGDTLDCLVRVGVNESRYFEFEDSDETEFVVVPHHSSQQLFDKALTSIINDPFVKRDILFLHCNYNNPFAQDDASLNLEPEMANALLEKFHYIVLGHEHNYREELGGKLLILGNTHPTNFGDITDKYYWDYDGDTKTFTKTKIWDRDTKYAQVTIPELLAGSFVYQGQNFVEIVGKDIEPEKAPEIALAMKAIWECDEGELFMVRNNVEFKSLTADTIDTTAQLEDVTKSISKELETTDMHTLWVKHLKENSND